MEFKRINQIQLPDKRFYEIFLPILFIIIGSSSYKKGHKDYILYSSSKSALQNMYEGGLEFLRNTNLKLEMIHPKRINTNMIKHLVRQNSTNVLTPILVAKKIYKIIKNS